MIWVHILVPFRAEKGNIAWWHYDICECHSCQGAPKFRWWDMGCTVFKVFALCSWHGAAWSAWRTVNIYLNCATPLRCSAPLVINWENCDLQVMQFAVNIKGVHWGIAMVNSLEAIHVPLQSLHSVIFILIGGRWFALYVCSNYMNDDIHSDNGYLDTWDIYAGPP